MASSPPLPTSPPPPNPPHPAVSSRDGTTLTTPRDPKVAELHLMFPTVEPSVILLILESSHGSSDQAIEQLLQITDPEFKPDELHAVRHEEESQLDLDAQFARSLQMQDHQDLQPVHAPPPPQDGGPLPYEPRVRRNQRPMGVQQDPYQYQYQTQQQRGGENPPGMLALEDKIERYAEVGKQTFNSLFSKAKAKYSEYQADRETPGRPRESGWGEDGAGYGGRGVARQDQAWRQPGGGRGGEQNRMGQGDAHGKGGLWGDSASFSSRSESFSSESTLDPPSQPPPAPPKDVPIRQSPGRWQPSDSFDDPLPPARSLSSPTRTLGGSSPSNRMDMGGRRSPGVGSPGTGVGSPGRIDPAKLGILPKKRVDLLSTSPSPPTPSPRPPPVTVTDEDDENDPNPALPSAGKSIVAQIPKTPPTTSPYKLEDSDDELEYTRNPFDER